MGLHKPQAVDAATLSAMFEIETRRLILRIFRPDDLDQLALILGDPEVMKYLGIVAGKPMSREETADVLQSFIKSWEKYGLGRLAIVEKESGQLIGCCGLRLLEGTPEIVYVLGKAYWGKGYATEAARACLRHGFESLNLKRIVAVTRHGNLASQRVLERVGMRYEKEVTHYGVGGMGYVITLEEFEPDDVPYTLHSL